MEIDEMRKHEWSISWSGGKDSTATVILAHELMIPITEIVYVRMMFDDELPATLPIMTEFVDETAEVFRSWGYKVTIIPSKKTAMDLASAVYKRSKYPQNIGKKYGITHLMRGHCRFSTVMAETIKSIEAERELIGICSNEPERYVRLKENQESLLYLLGKTEQDALQICVDYGLLSPLYQLGFARDGCWFCPNVRKRERIYYREHYPELVKKIYGLIEMCDYDISRMANRNRWLEDYLKEQKQGGLFEEVK